MLKFKQYISEEITKNDLNQIEKYADKLFAAVGIDIEFTRHFLDRFTDARNKKPINSAELIRLFRLTYKKYGKKIAKMNPDAEAVISDMETDVNMPFVLNLDKDGMLDLVAKTVMRKKDFKTTSKVINYEKKWSDKYKSSIDCNNPKGFSQRAHCQGRKK